MCIAFASWASVPVQPKVTKQVALIIAFYDFHPIEYYDTKAVLEKAGFQITTVSNYQGIARASDDSTVKTDCGFITFDCLKYDAIVLIGGAGSPRNLDQKQVHTILQKAVQAKKIIGAICYTPRILAHADVIRGKKLTGWNDDMALDQILNEAGATYLPKDVLIDGTLVTADGPEAAVKFGNDLITLLNAR